MIPFKMVRFLQAISKGPAYAPLCMLAARQLVGEG
jgi:hypothetical protein